MMFANENSKVFFVDNDHAQKKSICAVFPGARVLLCWFHVKKFVKSNIAKQETWTKGSKEELLEMFSAMMHARNLEDSNVKEELFLNKASSRLQKYYTSNLKPDIQEWAFDTQNGDEIK